MRFKASSAESSKIILCLISFNLLFSILQTLFSDYGEIMATNCRTVKGYLKINGKIMLAQWQIIADNSDMNRQEWHIKTQALIAQTSISINEISEATGLKPRWLRMLKADELEGPDVNKIQLVYNYLRRRK